MNEATAASTDTSTDVGPRRVSEDVVWIDGGDELRLYHSSTGEFETLNVTGAAIWRAVERGLTLDDVAARLAQEYGAEDEAQRAAIRSDISQFIDELTGRGILEIARADR